MQEGMDLYTNSYQSSFIYNASSVPPSAFSKHKTRSIVHVGLRRLVAWHVIEPLACSGRALLYENKKAQKTNVEDQARTWALDLSPDRGLELSIGRSSYSVSRVFDMSG